MIEYLWSFTEILKAVDGFGPVTGGVHGLSIDNRETYPGDLFIALEGQKTDGHRFVREALEAGAAAALVSKKPQGVDAKNPHLIWVKDTYEALLNLAAMARQRSGAKIIAVTGTAGKTGTKDAIAAALSMQGPTHASIKSFNNHVGVPLSLARMPRHAAFGVFEVGMNKPGEISPLSKLLRPHVALITTIGAGHLGAFTSEEEIAREKSAIFDGLSTSGTVVLNRDNAHYALLRNQAAGHGIKKVLDFSLDDPEATAIMLECHANGRSSQVASRIGSLRLDYKVSLPGSHWVTNSLAVLATVYAAGGDIGMAGHAMSGLTPQEGRGALYEVDTGTAIFRIIDESYNANPASMAATLEVFQNQKAEGAGRKIAVLGDMEELGTRARDEHKNLVPLIRKADIGLVYLKGKNMASLKSALKRDMKVVCLKSNAGIFKSLSKDIAAGDLVLVKGSRAGAMDEIVDQLLALHQLNEDEFAWGEPVAAAE